MSPRWRDDGRELFYLDPEGRLMSVAMVVRDGRIEPSRPVALFASPITAPTFNLDHYAPSADGKSFLFKIPLVQPDMRTVVLVNWF